MHLRTVPVFFCASLAFSVSAKPLQAVEQVGSYNVAPPTSAYLSDPGPPGPVLGWINVAPEPVSWNDAFSGPGIVDSGYANLPVGCKVGFTFAPHTLVNREGDDLLMIEARFSMGGYSIGVLHEGTWREVSVPDSAFASTEMTRSYYYDEPTNGPFPAVIYVAPLDLSAFGVPLGASPTEVSFRVTTYQSDPLGVAAVVPEPASLMLLCLAAAALRKPSRASQ